ncbi:hypothetical protein M5X11_30835 [Paenibacillus alginolyticus]|uniref:AbiTii domain-containing protein n=1 Tax=Paenibacillus alginolyticus TaxID=59839 RepID=UPI000401A241|nr:hypothetical protein [Paenibacillus alginolyticus]MCY9669269.1 hypothetical protein [Paenibacillus alginolyticus]
MDSLVLELQREAYDEKTGVSALLRKAYVVAKKLKVGELETWIHDELNSYNVPYNQLPEYRIIRGEVKAWNPYNGWIPVIINADILDIISQNKISQSIPEIEQLLKTTSGSTLMMPLPHSIQEQLSELTQFDTKFALHFGKSQAEQIVHYVRNIILEWSLKLEEDGILGEGVSFSMHEKEEAQKQNYTIYNIHGNHNQIQQDTVHSQQSMMSSEMNMDAVREFVASLTEHLGQLKLDGDKRQKLDSEIMAINTQLKAGPKKNILQESFSTIRNVLEGLTGSIIASGLIYELDKIKF